jgi:hypothetical protein
MDFVDLATGAAARCVRRHLISRTTSAVRHRSMTMSDAIDGPKTQTPIVPLKCGTGAFMRPVFAGVRRSEV